MFKKGDKKPPGSGRKKGQEPKKIVKRAYDVLAEKGINPTEKIVEMIQSGRLEPEHEVGAWKFLSGQVEPKDPVRIEVGRIPEALAPSSALIDLVQPKLINPVTDEDD